LPTKVEPWRSQTKNKTHGFFCPCLSQDCSVFATPHACTFDPCEERFGGHLCKLGVLFAQTHGYDSNYFGRDVGMTTSGITTTLICKGSIGCGREGIKVKPLLGICK